MVNPIFPNLPGPIHPAAYVLFSFTIGSDCD